MEENGDWHPAKSTWSCPIPCDAVPSSGQATERKFEDGEVRTYSYVCYLNPCCRRFSIGERVRLTRAGVVSELEVKGRMSYQHQYKIWLG